MKNLILIITGPTATGKTALGVELALALSGEVVSADSMQLYRRMDIGTAKPDAAETRGVPHHMLDVAEPWESYSAARYVSDAARCVDDILARGRLPILVGGTNLYIDSLVSGRSFLGGSEELRESLSADYDREGGEALLLRLSSLDPERAAALHPNDKKRVVRALEVCLATGKTLSEHDAQTRAAPPRYDSVKIALSFSDRARLYRRIDRRVDAMMSRGLLKEVEALLKLPGVAGSTAMQAIGYKELAAAIGGRCSVEEAVETVKRESRRYAKRQLSWLRRDGAVNWLLWEGEPDNQLGRRFSTELLKKSGIM